jgi:hypothetical protein
MNTGNHSEALEQRIEGALARLPEWQPPPDFAARLAAAAARAVPAARVRPESFWAVVLDHFNNLFPTLVWSAGLAGVLALAVPWPQLAAGDGLVWTCVAAMGAAGLVLTLRVLRAT